MNIASVDTTTAADSAAPQAPAPAAPPSAAPDWSSVREAVRCPLCEYDLRGLAEPRCPECGYAFTWPDVTDPERRLHPYLFEHHPERNAWSFRRTVLGTLRPRPFWAALRPAQPGRPRRLVLYWVLAALPMVLAAAAWSAQETRRYVQNTIATRARVRAAPVARTQSPPVEDIVRQFGSIGAYLEAAYPTRPGVRFFYRPGWGRGPGAANGVVLAWLAWPWLTFSTLLVFQFSMRRARVRVVHVLRCVLYGFDAVLWAGLAVAAAVAWDLCTAGTAAPLRMPGLTPDWLGMLLSGFTPDVVSRTAVVAGVVLLPFMAYRTVVAYRDYLRFDRPAATVLASQLIVLLIVFVACVRVQLA